MDPLILRGAIVAAQQIVAAASLIFDNMPTQHEVRVEKKRKHEVTPYKPNVSMRSGPPETMLEPVHVLEGLLHDDNHEYIKKIMHLHSWQFFLLADHLKDLISRPRDNNQSAKVGPAVMYDHHHRLLFALKWLNDGNFHRTREAEFGWSKMSLQHASSMCYVPLLRGLTMNCSGLVLIGGLSWPMFTLEFFTVVLELEM
jgi:hypothetical protein